MTSTFKFLDTCNDDAECQGMEPLCHHEIYRDMVQRQCRKTCGVCKADTEGCNDRHKK